MKKMMTELEPSICYDGETEANYWVRCGDLNQVAQLHQQGVDFNKPNPSGPKKGETPILTALRSRHLCRNEMVMYLVEQCRVDLNRHYNVNDFSEDNRFIRLYLQNKDSGFTIHTALELLDCVPLKIFLLPQPVKPILDANDVLAELAYFTQDTCVEWRRVNMPDQSVILTTKVKKMSTAHYLQALFVEMNLTTKCELTLLNQQPVIKLLGDKLHDPLIRQKLSKPFDTYGSHTMFGNFLSVCNSLCPLKIRVNPQTFLLELHHNEGNRKQKKLQLLYAFLQELCDIEKVVQLEDFGFSIVALQNFNGTLTPLFAGEKCLPRLDKAVTWIKKNPNASIATIPAAHKEINRQLYLEFLNSLTADNIFKSATIYHQHFAIFNKPLAFDREFTVMQMLKNGCTMSSLLWIIELIYGTENIELQTENVRLILLFLANSNFKLEYSREILAKINTPKMRAQCLAQRDIGAAGALGIVASDSDMDKVDKYNATPGFYLLLGGLLTTQSDQKLSELIPLHEQKKININQLCTTLVKAPNSREITFALIAAKAGAWNYIFRLLDGGYLSVNAKLGYLDGTKLSLLLIAALVNRTDIIPLLIKKYHADIRPLLFQTVMLGSAKKLQEILVNYSVEFTLEFKVADFEDCRKVDVKKLGNAYARNCQNPKKSNCFTLKELADHQQYRTVQNFCEHYSDTAVQLVTDLHNEGLLTSLFINKKTLPHVVALKLAEPAMQQIANSIQIDYQTISSEDNWVLVTIPLTLENVVKIADSAAQIRGFLQANKLPSLSMTSPQQEEVAENRYPDNTQHQELRDQLLKIISPFFGVKWVLDDGVYVADVLIKKADKNLRMQNLIFFMQYLTYYCGIEAPNNIIEFQSEPKDNGTLWHLRLQYNTLNIPELTKINDKDNAKFLRRSATDVSEINTGLPSCQAIATALQDKDKERKKLRTIADEPTEAPVPKIQKAKPQQKKPKKSDKKPGGNSNNNPPTQDPQEQPKPIANAIKPKSKRTGPKIKPQPEFEIIPRAAAPYVFISADKIPEHNYLLDDEEEKSVEDKPIQNQDDLQPHEERTEDLPADHNLEEGNSNYRSGPSF